MSAKVLATALAMHFNYERWKLTGSLDAGGQGGTYGGLGFRRISEETGMPHQTITRAQKALEAAGCLLVKRSRKFDPATGRKEANCYVAQVTPRSQHQDTPRDHNLCLTPDQNIQRPPVSASVASQRDAREGSQFDFNGRNQGASEEVDQYLEDLAESILGADGTPMTVAGLANACRNFDQAPDTTPSDIRRLVRASDLFVIGERDYVHLREWLDEDGQAVA